MKRILLSSAFFLLFFNNAFSQWSSVELTNENLFDVFFVDESTGWIVGNNTILKTVDAGDNWVSQVPGPNSRYHSVYFKDHMNGWAVGRNTSTTAGKIHYTTNGGLTWIVYPGGATAPLYCIDFANDNQGVTVGLEGQIKYTPDGGTNWYDRTSPSGVLGAIRRVTFYDGLKGIAVGYSTPSVGFIMKTIDGGNSWVNIDTNITGGLEAVSFISNTEGMVVGSGGAIYKTLDGGDNWTAIESNTTQNLNGLVYLSETKIIAVGASGSIIQSIDGGSNWELQESEAVSTLRSISKNSLYSAFAVGALGEVFKYCDECDRMAVFNVDYQMNVVAELQIEELSIAADNSRSTKFRFSGNNFQNASLRIKEDGNSGNNDLWGGFNDGDVINNEYKEFIYTHPEIFELSNQKSINATIEVINTQNMTLMKEYPIKIVRPSVLMVHGIWSDGDESFGDLEDTLIQANMYNREQINKVYYQNDAFNFENVSTYFIPHKNALKYLARKENISLGKVDILAHSNGGLLSRLYIQSEQYQKDVNKLITFNTPHSGSQFANLLFDPEYYFLHPILEELGKSTTNGVISDLRVDGEFITNLRNTAANTSNVALHTLTSTKETGLTGLAIETGWNYLVSRYMLYHLQIQNPDVYLDDLFNTDSYDLIVPSASQIGGINTTLNTADQFHSGSTENSEMQDRAINLLNSNPNDTNYFTFDGYQPPVLTYDFGPSERLSFQETNETLTIINPVEATVYNAGDIVNINVSGSAGILNIVSSMGNARVPLQNHVIENSSTDSFDFTIPNDALGRLEIVSVGFDSSGYADFDSTFIIVNTDAHLESITVVQNLIYVPEDRQTYITILGHYDDGITRDITHLQGLTYTFANQNAEIVESGFVNGLIEGEDMLTVTYQTKTATVPIIIANADEWVEVTLNTPEALEDKNLIKIFPNPTKGLLNINFSKSISELKITIYDTTGQLLLTKMMNSSENQIDISQLQSSLYFIKIDTNNSSTTKLFIKQ